MEVATKEPEVMDEATKERLAKGSMEGWLTAHKIKNEKGDPISFDNHEFQIDIYEDQSQNLVVMKAAQVGMSTIEVLKNFRDAETHKMDVIYTLPTDGDVGVFVGGKVNRIIANNPHLQTLTKDKDSVEQKQVGLSMLYFRGTWTKKSAIMITADRLVHDEKDSSKQEVIADYQARLQHSKFKQIHVFSHPSVPNNGVDVEWRVSDQKEWFITCPHCQKRQVLTWNIDNPKKMSIDLERQIFICKTCKGELSNDDRATGQWVKKFKDRKWSGYHVSLLMNPEIPASQVIEKYNEVLAGKQSMDFFYNKVLGLPYAGGGNSVLEEDINGIITTDKNLYQGRLVLGVDSGIKLRYVIGNKQGIVGYGEMPAWIPNPDLKIPLEQSIEYFLIKFPNLIAVFDQGGDIIGPRQLQAKYPGRVFLCFYNKDRNAKELVRWGEKDEYGKVQVDRNALINLVVGEVKDKRFFLYNGKTIADWHNYWLHFSHIYRIVEEDNLGVKRYVWLRSDRDDWVHATVYWRVGIMKYGAEGGIAGDDLRPDANSYIVNPDQTVDFNPHDMFGRNSGLGGARAPQGYDEPWWADNDSEPDWRDV